ncbi:MAG TPA: hypothetical protein VL727_06695 [Puia sp.]|jgi:uncharacterized membrane protein|nr:hypothetical protein [Puia sp.]
MAALSTLGIIHTAISLVAVGSGIVSFFRHGGISYKNGVGRTYVITTALTCLTGFGIFHHGGFGKPHMLGIITLVVLALAYAGGKKLFGRASPYLETVLYSMTFFFHLIPGVTESLTRLPVDAPIASGPDDPLVQKLVGICFLLFIAGATAQVIRLRNRSKAQRGGVVA